MQKLNRTLLGISSLYANGIDAAGEVVGKAYPSTSAPAFLNPGGTRPTPVDIHPTEGESIPFAYLSGPFGIPISLWFSPPEPNKGWEAETTSKRGKHMGGKWWDTANKPRAWVGPGGQGGSGSGANFNLGGGGLGGNGSWCNAVNDAGQAVGAAYNGSGFAVAFLYSGGAMQDLNSLAQNLPPGVILAEAYGINNSGKVVGQAGGAKGTAFLYDGDYHDLGTLKAPYNEGSCAYAINSSGQVAGYSSSAAADSHAFLYTNGKMQDLGALPGGLVCWALAVNDLGQVVGYSSSAVDTRAFLYSGGAMHDLNDLVLNPPAGVLLTAAYGINDGGQIIAMGTRGHAYLLTPVSAQSAVDLLLLE